MKAALESPRFNPAHASLTAFERTEPAFAWNWHHHAEYELTWIRRGRGTRLVGDHHEAYAPDDLILLAPHLPHTWASAPALAPTRKRTRTSADHSALVIQFGPAGFPAELLARPEFRPISRLLTASTRGLSFAPAVAQQLAPRLAALPGLPPLHAWTHLVEILDTLAAVPDPRPLSSPRYRNRRAYHVNNRLERALTQLDHTYRDALPLRQIARRCGLSSSAFSRLLRRLTGQTYVQARNTRRVQEACRLLTETDLPITSVALESGFENLSHFHRVFAAAKNLTPLAYRRLHENPTPR